MALRQRRGFGWRRQSAGMIEMRMRLTGDPVSKRQILDSVLLVESANVMLTSLISETSSSDSDGWSSIWRELTAATTLAAVLVDRFPCCARRSWANNGLCPAGTGRYVGFGQFWCWWPTCQHLKQASLARRGNGQSGFMCPSVLEQLKQRTTSVVGGLGGRLAGRVDGRLVEGVGAAVWRLVIAVCGRVPAKRRGRFIRTSLFNSAAEVAAERQLLASGHWAER